MTKYLTDEKTQSAKKSKMFERFIHITDQVYEVELVKSEIEHREPIIVGIFILHDAKLRILDLHYNFSKKFCDSDKYEELEMDADSLYLALSDEKLEYVILPKKGAEWDQLPSKDCTDNFTANATDIFSPRTCCNVHKKHNKRESQVSSKKSLDVYKCCDSVAKQIVVMINRLTSTSLAANDSKKRTLEECGDGRLMSKYRNFLEEAVNVTSNKTGFQTKQRIVATYGQIKKRLSYFYPKRLVE